MPEKTSLRQKFRKAYDGFFENSGTNSRGLIAELQSPIDSFNWATRISVDSLFTIWRNSSDVFGAVRELKEGIGSAGYVWLNKKNSNEPPSQQEVEQAEAVLNYDRTFRRFKSHLIQTERISGNAYLLILRSAGPESKVLGFDFIDPRTMSVVTDQYGKIYKWIQRCNGTTQEFQPEEILHYKTDDDPNSPVFGFSPIETVIWETRSDLAAMISNYALHSNDSTPGAQYILDETLPVEEQKKVVENIREQLKGPMNKHKSIAMVGVKEVKTINITPKEMEFILQRKFTTEKICSALGVPKAILGYTDDVNLANGGEQTKKFWEATIQPAEESLAEFINRVMLPAIGIQNIKIEFKAREFDNREWNEASSRADQQQGILTINEIREERGYEKFDPKVEGEWVDKPLIWNGPSVQPVEDIGLGVDEDGIPAILDDDEAEKQIRKFEEFKKRNQYGNTGKDKPSN